MRPKTKYPQSNYIAPNIAIVIQSQSCIVDKVRVQDRVKPNICKELSVLQAALSGQLSPAERTPSHLHLNEDHIVN